MPITHSPASDRKYWDEALETQCDVATHKAKRVEDRRSGVWG